FDYLDGLAAAEAAVTRRGQISAEIQAASELLGGLDKGTDLDAAQVGVAGVLGVARADIGCGVDAIVLAEKIDHGAGETAARQKRLGKKAMQLARPHRHLLATGRADPEAGDGSVAEQMPARFEGVADILRKLGGIGCRRPRANLAGSGDHSQTQ